MFIYDCFNLLFNHGLIVVMLREYLVSFRMKVFLLLRLGNSIDSVIVLLYTSRLFFIFRLHLALLILLVNFALSVCFLLRFFESFRPFFVYRLLTAFRLVTCGVAPVLV